MAEEYELKQVKVRLKLTEAEPLYSTEQLTTPDKAVEVMAQALAQMDREYCCVVNLDGANHPINFNVVSIGDVNQAQVPIQNVFKSAILSNAASIMMFHNHPSGVIRASQADIDITRVLIEAGNIMNIPVLDHIIVAGGTAEHFSFRTCIPDMFSDRKEAEYSVHDNQLSDIPPAPEKKKESRREKAVRVEEHKKACNRVSMKEKLAEKKAEIAERDSKSHEAEKVKKSPSIGVED